MLSLAVLVFLLILAPTDHHANEVQVVMARKNAEVLALQLAQIYTQSKAGRGPAAASDLEGEFKGEGLIGVDPWGQPYKYNVLKTDQGIARIVVTSDGPPTDANSDDTKVTNEIDSENSSGKIKYVISPSE